jgi:hypothetical protein
MPVASVRRRSCSVQRSVVSPPASSTIFLSSRALAFEKSENGVLVVNTSPRLGHLSACGAKLQISASASGESGTSMAKPFFARSAGIVQLASD